MEQNNIYKVEFLPAALYDITEITSSFVMLGSKTGALRIKDKINHAVSQISTFPYMGITVPYKGLEKASYRMIIIEQYLLFYRIFLDEQKIIIYRMLNGKTNYPQLLRRIKAE